MIWRECLVPCGCRLPKIGRGRVPWGGLQCDMLIKSVTALTGDPLVNVFKKKG